MKFSVVIPAYNVEAYLEECLDSVAAQSYKDWEAIIVDDGSTDGSAALAETWTRKDKRFHLLKQENQGLSAARNTGMDLAQGEYLLFLDADDWLDPDALEVLYRLTGNNHVDVIAFGSTLFNEVNQSVTPNDSFNPREHRTYTTGRLYLDSFVQERNWGPSAACFYLWKTQMMKKNSIKFPRGLRHEDEFFVPIALLHAQEVITTPQSVYFYRKHDNTITQKTSAQNYIDLYTIVSKLETEFKTLGYDNLYSNRILYNLSRKVLSCTSPLPKNIKKECLRIGFRHHHGLKELVKLFTRSPKNPKITEQV